MQHYFTRLERQIKSNWEGNALCNYKGEKFTFGDMATQIAKFHMFFERAGIKKGEKVAICAKNTARWGISFMASSTYGTITVPILVDFHPESVNGLVTHSESVVLFTDDDVWAKLDIAKMASVRVVISTQNYSLLYSASDEVKSIYENLEREFNKAFPKGFGPDDVSYPTENLKDLAIINYTSGSTGAPKGVMLRHECLSANADFGQRWLPSRPGENIVSMLPMAHMYGMMFELIYPLCGGSTIYYLGKTPTPAVLLGAMAEVKPYLLVTVPLVMEKVFKGKVQPILNKPVMKIITAIPGVNQIIFKKIRNTLLNAFGGNLRSIIMGGAALNPDVEKWFKKFKLPFTVGYGMTEAAPLLAYEPWETFVPHSCGKAIDCVEVRIDSEDPYNVVGQIQARGISIMSGYYKNEEATKAAFTDDGWMNTGDLGVIDKAGNIFIRGRSKNMILTSNGQNIYPEEIEAVCNNQQYVIESVVVDRKGVLVALLYMDQDKLKADGLVEGALEDKLNEIKGIINKDMPVYSKVGKIEVMDKPFEKTPKMSIKRFLYS